MPSLTTTSLWQIPQASTLMRTCPRPTPGWDARPARTARRACSTCTAFIRAMCCPPLPSAGSDFDVNLLLRRRAAAVDAPDDAFTEPDAANVRARPHVVGRNPRAGRRPARSSRSGGWRRGRGRCRRRSTRRRGRSPASAGRPRSARMSRGRAGAGPRAGTNSEPSRSASSTRHALEVRELPEPGRALDLEAVAVEAVVLAAGPRSAGS